MRQTSKSLFYKNYINTPKYIYVKLGFWQRVNYKLYKIYSTWNIAATFCTFVTVERLLYICIHIKMYRYIIHKGILLYMWLRYWNKPTFLIRICIIIMKNLMHSIDLYNQYIIWYYMNLYSFVLFTCKVSWNHETTVPTLFHLWLIVKSTLKAFHYENIGLYLHVI